MILADYDPGTLSGFYTILLTGICMVVCVAGAVGGYFARRSQVVKWWLKVAWLFLFAGIVMLLLESLLSKKLQLP